MAPRPPTTASPYGSVGSIGARNVGDNYMAYVPDTIYNNALAGQMRDIGAQRVGLQNQQVPFMDAALANGATIDQSQQAQFRNQQLQLSNALMAQANGQGPSVAGAQLQQSTDMNLQAALAQAASSRGGNLGAMQYQLGNARANIQQQAAQQLAMTRIQEQMAARSQLGAVLDSGRGQDIGLATGQANLTQQNNQFNAANQQQANAVNVGTQAEHQARIDAMTMQYIQMGMSAEQANRMAMIQQAQFASGQLNSAAAASAGVALQNNAQNVQLAGGIAGAIGAVAGGAVGSMAGPAGTAAGAAAGGAGGAAIGRAVAGA